VASIRPAGEGRWRVAVAKPGGRDPVTGKYGMVVRVVKGTKKEAKSVARDIETKLETGQWADGGKVSLAQFLEDRWLPHVATRTRPRTHGRYAEILRRHVIPRIGSVTLAKLRPSHVQSVLDGMLGDGLAPRTVLHGYRVLSEALAEGVEWQVLALNVAKAIKPPRPDRPKLFIPDAEGVSALLVAAEGTRYHAALVLAATTGMRRGEVLGLRWSNVDLEGGVLRVNDSLQRHGTALEFVEPKTDKSRREVTLPPMAVVTLRRHRKDQSERRLLAGEGWHDDDLVFDRGDGRPVEPGELSSALKKVAMKAGLPGRLRLHDLRHAFATMALNGNVHPKFVSEALGHSNIAITLDTYSHVLKGMGDAAAQAIQAALGDTAH
jgi:integrase